MTASGGARIGVFGGAFDPPHTAHVALARAGLNQLKLDELQVFPTGDAWHKPRTLSPAHDRVAMARLAFADVPRVTVDERETQRAGPTYTVDTLEQLQQEHPQAQLYLLLGGDQARALPTWRRWEDVLRLAIICVALREESTPVPGGFDHQFDYPDAIRARLQHLTMAPMAVGSTQIRSRIAAGQGIDDLVPGPVARYIAQHQLYLNT